MATFIEAAPGPPEMRMGGGMFGGELAKVRLEADGRLTVITAQAPHGQGHETTLAQVAADEMGVPFEHVRVVYGDTRVDALQRRSAPAAAGLRHGRPERWSARRAG